MTYNKLAHDLKAALDLWDRLPPEEQVRRLVARGTINGQGEVLLGRDLTDEVLPGTPVAYVPDWVI